MKCGRSSLRRRATIRPPNANIWPDIEGALTTHRGAEEICDVFYPCGLRMRPVNQDALFECACARDCWSIYPYRPSLEDVGVERHPKEALEDSIV